MASRLKRSNCPKWNFFSKSNKIFMYLFAPFILQNIKRILWADPELSGCAIFSHKMAHLSWKFFFGANHYYYFHLPVGPFYCAKFTTNSYGWFKVVGMPIFRPKKILPVDPELWRCAIFGHTMAHLPKWDFFQKTC